MKISRSMVLEEKVLRDGYIALDSGRGEELYYVVCRINTDNFKDIGENLIAQLKEENKYNDYIGFLSYNAFPPYSVQMLPIYGNATKYVTKWFTETAEETIRKDIRNKETCLLQRADINLESNV